jgi:hypothetical protein
MRCPGGQALQLCLGVVPGVPMPNVRRYEREADARAHRGNAPQQEADYTAHHASLIGLPWRGSPRTNDKLSSHQRCLHWNYLLISASRPEAIHGFFYAREHSKIQFVIWRC